MAKMDALEALKAELAKLQAENQALKSAPGNTLSFKVGEKGGMSVYGLSARFPVTLYKSQWKRLIAAVPAMEKFMTEHDAELVEKGAKVEASSSATSVATPEQIAALTVK